ncbi:MAG TPA: phage tail protein [Frankiaceae bacterium]|nr:phage tail protein [Frankiaceae bacterium]
MSDVVAGFSVKLDDLDLGMWTEVALGGMSITIEQRPDGGASGTVHQLRGQIEYDKITLSRVMTDGASMMAWFRKQARETRRMHGEIVVYASTGQPLQRWSFIEAIPVRWTIPPMRSGDLAAVVETLEIAHQGFVD